MRLRRKEPARPSYDEPALPTYEELVQELMVLARLRSLGRFRTTELPALYSLPGVRGDSAEAALPILSERLRESTATALARIHDAHHRRAAAFIFDFGDYRWTPLQMRQSQAAKVFGVGFDAYRRRKPTGMSLYQETVLELALALVSLQYGADAHTIALHNDNRAAPSAVTLVPTDKDRTAPSVHQLEEELDPSEGARRRLAAAAGNQADFAGLLRDYRMTAGLTQERLSECSGVSFQTISNLERGVGHRPRHTTVEALVSGLFLNGGLPGQDSARPITGDSTGPIAERLLLAMKRAGVTQYEMAKRLHSDPRVLRRYLSGERIPPPEVTALWERECGLPAGALSSTRTTRPG